MHPARWLVVPAVILASIVGCGGTESESEAAVAESAVHSWGGYHWARTANPFNVNLGDNVDETWQRHLDRASDEWSGGSTVLDTTVVAGATSTRRCRPTRGQVEVCNDNYGQNGWLGVATIWAIGRHITQATVKVNDSYFANTRYDYGTYEWRQFVMCQEVGHTFGLDHQDERFSNANLGTCMDYTNEPASNVSPNKHDYDMLVTIYTHLDTTTTLSQPAGALPPQASGEADDAADPAAWGRLIRQNGRFEVYEHDLGDGRKITRFVIRA